VALVNLSQQSEGHAMALGLALTSGYGRFCPMKVRRAARLSRRWRAVDGARTIAADIVVRVADDLFSLRSQRYRVRRLSAFRAHLNAALSRYTLAIPRSSAA